MLENGLWKEQVFTKTIPNMELYINKEFDGDAPIIKIQTQQMHLRKHKLNRMQDRLMLTQKADNNKTFYCQRIANFFMRTAVKRKIKMMSLQLILCSQSVLKRCGN